MCVCVCVCVCVCMCVCVHTFWPQLQNLRSLGHSPKVFRVLTPLQTMQPSLVLIYRGVDILEKS